MKEESKNLITKWSDFLSDLTLTNTQRLNYSKFLENIALFNRRDLKFALSLGFRLLKETKELHIITRKKNPEKIHILNFEEESLYDSGVIIIDYAMSLLPKCVKEIQSKLPSDFKISSIEIERESNILSVYLIL